MKNFECYFDMVSDSKESISKDCNWVCNRATTLMLNDIAEAINKLQGALTEDELPKHHLRKGIILLLKNNNGHLRLHLRGIARKLGEKYPEKIKYHLKKLEENEEIAVDWKGKEIKLNI